jgi:hypothetical protein
MGMAVSNPVARTGLQFLAYSCFALAASNIVVEANFNSKLNLAWIILGAVMTALIFQQGMVARIVLATLLAMMGFAILGVTAAGELYWANWRPAF